MTIPLVTAAVNLPSHQLLSELAAMLQIRILKPSVLLRWHPRASHVPEPLSSSPRPKTCCPLAPASHTFSFFLSFFFLLLCLFKGGQGGRTSAGGEGPQPSVWESASPPAALPGEDHGNTITQTFSTGGAAGAYQSYYTPDGSPLSLRATQRQLVWIHDLAVLLHI